MLARRLLGIRHDKVYLLAHSALPSDCDQRFRQIAANDRCVRRVRQARAMSCPARSPRPARERARRDASWIARQARRRCLPRRGPCRASVGPRFHRSSRTSPGLFIASPLAWSAPLRQQHASMPFEISSCARRQAPARAARADRHARRADGAQRLRHRRDDPGAAGHRPLARRRRGEPTASWSSIAYFIGFGSTQLHLGPARRPLRPQADPRRRDRALRPVRLAVRASPAASRC